MYTQLMPNANDVTTAATLIGRWDGVLKLHAMVEQATSAQLRRYGLGLSEFRALHLLAGFEAHEVRLLDLADALSLDRSSVSRVVDRLVANELARRESCGDDRRGVFIAITGQGEERYRSVAPVYEGAITAAIGQAALRPELTALTGLLTQPL